MPLNNQFPDSPLKMVVGESIAYSVAFEKDSLVLDEAVTVWREEEDITATAMPSGAHSISNNILTLKPLVILDDDEGTDYIIEVQAKVNGNTLIKKLVVNVYAAWDENNLVSGLAGLVEDASRNFRVEFLGASKAGSSEVAVYRNEEVITTDVVAGFVTESGNIVITPMITALSGDDGENYVIAIKSTINGNILIAKIVVTIEDPKTKF